MSASETLVDGNVPDVAVVLVVAEVVVVVAADPLPHAARLKAATTARTPTRQNDPLPVERRLPLWPCGRRSESHRGSS